jgi:eukaryotic-like serine/threonine-protein kinase
VAVKCPKCHFENPETQKWCGECGIQIPSLKDIHPEVTETLQTPVKELTTGSTFALRYQIIEELGKGGMGKVYKVFDKEIEAKIALKLIKPEVAADKTTIERFRNELKIARDISHKNICRMYDLGKEAGNYFITMEYVQGEDLKRLIRKMGQLSPGQAISIGKQICEGLAEAHRLGVVHRDLKPQNIMVDEDGNARIMDFGIARSIMAKGITGAGVMIGTPEYMSPEQVEGKEADLRSDIYSLGIVLYEMVTGRVPFEGDTPFTIGVKHKSEIPKNPREINAQIPEDLGRLILKCMAKDKDKRYQSTKDVAEDLARIEKELPTTEKLIPKRRAKTEQAPGVGQRKYVLYGAVVVLAVIVVAAGIFLFSGRGKEITSIAVMPFSYGGSGGTEMEYLAEGMTESIINKLSQLSSLKKVIARSSVFHYKGKEIVPKVAGQELGVEAVLISKMYQRGDEFSINVELVKTADNSRIWGDQYKRKASEIFHVQDEISSSIADNLRLKLIGEELKRITKHYTESAEAYRAYVRGRFFWDKRTEEGLKAAIDYFQVAIGKDPKYALAYAGLADSYALLPEYSAFPAKEASEKTKAAAAKALEIDDALSEAHASLAEIKESWDWDWGSAEKEFKRAIELNPGYATAHHWYALLLMKLGRHDESLVEIKKAQELDPLSLIINANAGFILYNARRTDEAIEHYRKALEMDPSFGELHKYMGWAYAQKGLHEEALEETQKAIILSGRIPPYLSVLGYVYALSGKKNDALKIIDELKTVSDDKYLIAEVYAGLGEKDQAFEYFQKACEGRSPWMPHFKVDPKLDSLRSDPRFKVLLKRMKLES